jgi:hypothetical protein
MKIKTTELTGFQVIQIIKKSEQKEHKKGLCMKVKLLKETIQNKILMMVQLLRGKYGGIDRNGRRKIRTIGEIIRKI